MGSLLIQSCFWLIFFTYSVYSVPQRPSICTENMFHCRNSRCVSMEWRCDGDNDCGDMSDEEDCNENTPCALHQYKCPGPKRRCIPETWVCDNHSDCDGGEDEKNCTEKFCKDDQFKCSPVPPRNYTVCIPQSWVCDGQEDCASGEDERSSQCNFTTEGVSQAPRGCAAHEFRCDNGVCIFDRWKCDWDNDCGDHSDEKEEMCKDVRHCGEGYFKCMNEETNYCIPHRWVCDGEADCQDHSDEANCTTPNPKAEILHPATCSEQEFACGTDHCIHNAWKCDHDPDCPDGSDEENCPATACKDDEVMCTYDQQHCIPKSALCNGQMECPDLSDEENCTKEASKCAETTEIQCPDKSCVKLQKLCDGNPDCAPTESGKPSLDESPELCGQEKKNCGENQGGCDHICNGAKIGRYCTCHDGYKRVNFTKCEDIDECQTKVGACSQLCTNTRGSFKCSCHKGYILQRDKRTCRAMGREGPKLLLSNRINIRKIDLETREYLPLISDLHSAVAMDYMYKTRTLIWSDIAKEKIMMCNVSDSYISVHGSYDNATHCQRELVSENISTPDGLAVDWVHDLLFWTDTGMDRISVISLKTERHRCVLFDKDLDEPRAIALDPKAGVIFWTDWGEKPKIERAGMDGTERQTIVSENIQWPNGLAVDILEQRIFWADAKLKLIKSSDYHGENQRTVLHSWFTLRHPFSLSVFEEHLYWTDWDTEGVHQANKFTGANATLVVGNLFGPMTVRVYHQMYQPDHIPDKCLGHTCSHLCLPAPHLHAGKFGRDKFNYQRAKMRSYTCKCPDGNSAGSGDTCLDYTIDVRSIKGSASGFRVTTFIVLFSMAILFAVIVWIVWRRRIDPNHRLKTLNFENPVYRRTVTESGEDLSDQLKLRWDADYHRGQFPGANTSSLTQPLTEDDI